eukprot:Em0095g11a
MLSFKTCEEAPVRGGRGGLGGGGLVEVEGRVVWGGYGGVYMYEEDRWSRVADGGEYGGTLAVCGGRLVWVGGRKDGVRSKKVKVLRGRRWSVMPDMLVECMESCVVSVSGGGMVVMGGYGDGLRYLNDVQVFDGGTQTWHRGPSLPKPCAAMSAVVLWRRGLRDGSNLYGERYQMYQNMQVVVCVVRWCAPCNGVKMQDGSRQTSSIYGLHHDERSGGHVGDMPIAMFLGGTTTAAVRRRGAVDGGWGTLHRFLKITVQAGVGKTHLKHLLLKKDPPQQRVSTGLADNPVRAISFSLAGVGSFPKMAIQVSSDGAGAPFTLTPHLLVSHVTMDTSHQSRTNPGVAIFVLNLSEELSHHPAIAYYGGRWQAKILPQTVFCDPQVVLTKVTELVEYHHKLLHSPNEGVAAESDLVTFRDHGLLSVELLSKFPKHYTEELVTLVDMFSYILLHINEMSSEVCREIRCCVHSGIKSACGILKYQGVQFKDAFMCAGASCTSDPSHVAVVVSEKKWKCSIVGDQRGDLNPVSLDSEPSLPLLLDKVAAVIPHKYEIDWTSTSSLTS